METNNLLFKIRNKANNIFDNFIFVIIFLSSILIGLETNFELVNAYAWWFHVCDMLFLSIFVIEVVIKLIAYSPKSYQYFTDPWNFFDFIIIVLSFLPYIISHGQQDTHAVAAFRIFRLVRAIRIIRVLRLIPKVKQLQEIVETLLKSIPSLFYVLVLLFILFYIYGVLGVFIFGHIDAAHFGNLPLAFLTLFECITGTWVELVDILIKDQHITYHILVPIYFISFYFLAGLIILNLFIGVIVTELSNIKEKQINQELIAGFQDDLDEQQNILLVDLQEQIKKINETFRKLQLSLDKQKGKG